MYHVPIEIPFTAAFKIINAPPQCLPGSSLLLMEMQSIFALSETFKADKFELNGSVFGRCCQTRY